MKQYCSPKAALVFRTLYSSFGIVVGLAVCAAFNVAFDNRPAAFLGLLSGVLAAVCLLQFLYLHLRVEVQHRLPHVPLLCLFGVLGALGVSLGVGTFVAFLGLGIVDSIDHKDLSLPETHYISTIWAFANFKWGLTAFYYALKTFRKMSRNQFQLLENTEENTEENGTEDTTIQS